VDRPGEHRVVRIARALAASVLGEARAIDGSVAVRVGVDVVERSVCLSSGGRVREGGARRAGFKGKCWRRASPHLSCLFISAHNSAPDRPPNAQNARALERTHTHTHTSSINSRASIRSSHSLQEARACAPSLSRE
jgi:hypothetical protein